MKRILTLILLAQACALSLMAQSLTIEVRDIEKPTGHLYVALYNSEASFLRQPATGFRVEVTDTLLVIPCQGVPAGTYAISLFQDENGNGTLDTGTYGIPTEKYGFSLDAEGVMGPPSWNKACFTLPEKEDLRLVIHMR